MTVTSRALTRSFFVGLAGIAAIGLIVLFGISAASGPPGAETTVVRAEFKNVGATLKVGNDVRENSVRIGRVENISYDRGLAVVTLALDGNVPVYRDARAGVWDTSALAKKFVQFDRGRPEAGLLGDRAIPVSRTEGSADLDRVLDVLDPRTRAALAGTLHEAGGGVAGHGGDLNALLGHAPAILRGVGRTSSALSSDQANLAGLLDRADQLAGSLSGREQEISALVRNVSRTAEAFGVDEGRPLQAMVRNLPETVRQARGALDALEQPLADTHEALAGLRSGAEALGRSTPDLRGILREAPTPLGLVPGVSTRAQPAVDDLTRTVADARPLMPALSRGVRYAAAPVNTLAQYSGDIVEFFRRIESMVSTSLSPGVHAAYLAPALGGPSVISGGVLADPLQGQDAYPAPGEADGQRANSPLNDQPGGAK